jgi:hypothetical protein
VATGNNGVAAHKAAGSVPGAWTAAHTVHFTDSVRLE